MSSLESLRRVISGGQAGADIGALYAARDLNIPTGGTAPPGYKTLEGCQKDLLQSFGLTPFVSNKPVSFSVGLVSRSKKNVDDSDATIAFRMHPSVGTDKTIMYALFRKWTPLSQEAKEALITDSSEDGFIRLGPHIFVVTRLPNTNEELQKHRAAIHLFLTNIEILNVAGHRPYYEEWQEDVRRYLVEVLKTND